MVSTGADSGGLFFISGPILMAILLRSLGGDGWQDAGLRLGPLPWYLFALLLFPLTVGLILGIGVITGTILLRGSLGALMGAAVSRYFGVAGGDYDIDAVVAGNKNKRLCFLWYKPYFQLY